MMDKQYYRLELDDVSKPAFTSFGKSYFGTIDEITCFIQAIEAADYIEEHSSPGALIPAFHAYEQGNHDVQHPVAYHEVPFLTPALILHEEKHVLEGFAWEHLNTWRWPYNMRCSKVETVHRWVQCDDSFHRVLYAQFTDLEYQGTIGQWNQVGDMLWGYPEILHYDPPRIHNRLAEPECSFDSLEELEKDWVKFCKEPRPDFSEFCNDIFGDG